MTKTTKYRLYLKLKVGNLLDSKEHFMTAVVGGRSVKIQSESPPQPLSEAPWLVMESGGFETVDQAREFGEELQRAAHLAGLCSRVGVDAGDPGDDRTQSRFNPEFLHSAPSENPRVATRARCTRNRNLAGRRQHSVLSRTGRPIGTVKQRPLRPSARGGSSREQYVRERATVDSASHTAPEPRGDQRGPNRQDGAGSLHGGRLSD